MDINDEQLRGSLGAKFDGWEQETPSQGWDRIAAELKIQDKRPALAWWTIVPLLMIVLGGSVWLYQDQPATLATRTVSRTPSTNTPTQSAPKAPNTDTEAPTISGISYDAERLDQPSNTSTTPAADEPNYNPEVTSAINSNPAANSTSTTDNTPGQTQPTVPTQPGKVIVVPTSPQQQQAPQTEARTNTTMPAATNRRRTNRNVAATTNPATTQTTALAQNQPDDINATQQEVDGNNTAAQTKANEKLANQNKTNSKRVPKTQPQKVAPSAIANAASVNQVERPANSHFDHPKHRSLGRRQPALLSYRGNRADKVAPEGASRNAKTQPTKTQLATNKANSIDVANQPKGVDPTQDKPLATAVIGQPEVATAIGTAMQDSGATYAKPAQANNQALATATNPVEVATLKPDSAATTIPTQEPALHSPLTTNANRWGLYLSGYNTQQSILISPTGNQEILNANGTTNSRAEQRLSLDLGMVYSRRITDRFLVRGGMGLFFTQNQQQLSLTENQVIGYSTTNVGGVLTHTAQLQANTLDISQRRLFGQLQLGAQLYPIKGMSWYLHGAVSAYYQVLNADQTSSNGSKLSSTEVSDRYGNNPASPMNFGWQGGFGYMLPLGGRRQLFIEPEYRVLTNPLIFGNNLVRSQPQMLGISLRLLW